MVETSPELPDNIAQAIEAFGKIGDVVSTLKQETTKTLATVFYLNLVSPVVRQARWNSRQNIPAQTSSHADLNRHSHRRCEELDVMSFKML